MEEASHHLDTSALNLVVAAELKEDILQQNRSSEVLTKVLMRQEAETHFTFSSLFQDN